MLAALNLISSAVESWSLIHETTVVSRVNAHVTVLVVRMENAHSRASAQETAVSQDCSDNKANKNTNENDGDVDNLDPFSGSEE